MNFLERLEYHSSRLTNTERKISEYVLTHQSETVRVNIAELAQLCEASRSAVLRFTQKLGYSGSQSSGTISPCLSMRAW